MPGEAIAARTAEILGEITGYLRLAGISQAALDQISDLSRVLTAELTEDPAQREAEIETLAQLEPPEVIRHAEQLVRDRFSPVSPLYRIWGRVADDLNTVSHLPGRGDWGKNLRDIRRFNEGTAMAWAIIDQFHGRVKP